MFALNGERSGKRQPVNKRYGGSKTQKRFRPSRRPPSARSSQRGVWDASCGEPTNRALWALKMHGVTLAVGNAAGKREAVVGLDKRRLDSPRRAYRRNAFFGNRQRHRRIERRRPDNADERIYHQQYIETAAVPNRRSSVSRSLKSTVSDRSPAHRVRARRLAPALAVRASPPRAQPLGFDGVSASQVRALRRN